MIVQRGKRAWYTIVDELSGEKRERTMVIGMSRLGCTLAAGERIKKAMKRADEVSWNRGSGNEVRVFRDESEYDSGDRYIRTRLVTVSERGRRVEHAERKRPNPAWEGVEECGICYTRKLGVKKVRREADGKDVPACRACRKIVRMANELTERSRRAAAPAAAPATPAQPAAASGGGGGGSGERTGA